MEANHKSEIELKKLRFNYLDSPLELKVDNARCKIKDNNIEIENGNFKISNSDLLFNGMMRNFIPYLYNKANEIDLSGELLSNKSVFDELILIKNLSNDLEAKSTMPEWLNLNLKIKFSLLVKIMKK